MVLALLASFPSNPECFRTIFPDGLIICSAQPASFLYFALENITTITFNFLWAAGHAVGQTVFYENGHRSTGHSLLHLYTEYFKFKQMITDKYLNFQHI